MGSGDGVIGGLFVYEVRVVTWAFPVIGVSRMEFFESCNGLFRLCGDFFWVARQFLVVLCSDFRSGCLGVRWKFSVLVPCSSQGFRSRLPC